MRSRRSAVVVSVLALALTVGATQIVQADSGRAVAAKKCKKKKRKKCRKSAPPATGTPTTTVTSPGDTTTATTPAPPVLYPLAVAAGGGGSVFSSPTGISCPADCAENYSAGQVVNLTAQADFGFVFNGWSGACSADPCSVTMDGPKSVSASFIAGHTITVTLSSNASFPNDGGTVVSSPDGINCTRTGGQNSGSCAATFLSNTSVDLTVTPDVSILSGGRINWGGDCSALGSNSSTTVCNLNTSADRSVTIEFTET